MSTAITLTDTRAPQTPKVLAAGAVSLILPPFALVFAPALMLSIVAGVLSLKWGMDELKAIGAGEVAPQGKAAVLAGMGIGTLGIVFALGLLMAYFGLLAGLIAFLVFLS